MRACVARCSRASFADAGSIRPRLPTPEGGTAGKTPMWDTVMGEGPEVSPFCTGSDRPAGPDPADEQVDPRGGAAAQRSPGGGFRRRPDAGRPRGRAEPDLLAGTGRRAGLKGAVARAPTAFRPTAMSASRRSIGGERLREERTGGRHSTDGVSIASDGREQRRPGRPPRGRVGMKRRPPLAAQARAAPPFESPGTIRRFREECSQECGQLGIPRAPGPHGEERRRLFRLRRAYTCASEAGRVKPSPERCLRSEVHAR